MFLVLLLATVALVSMQYGVVASPQIQVTEEGKLDDNLLSNLIPSPHHRRQQKNFIKLLQPLPKSVHHVPGVDLELACVIVGSPAPQIQWMKNGQFVNDDVIQESNELFPVDPYTIATVVSTLIISAPSSNPADVYTCLGTSSDMKVKGSTTVFTDSENAAEFLQQFLGQPSKPRITYYYRTLVVDGFGRNLVLPCRVTSGADVQLYWLDNRNNVVHESNELRVKVLPSGDLFIPNIHWLHMGDWTCVVKNFKGEDSEATFLYPARSE